MVRQLIVRESVQVQNTIREGQGYGLGAFLDGEDQIFMEGNQNLSDAGLGEQVEGMVKDPGAVRRTLHKYVWAR